MGDANPVIAVSVNFREVRNFPEVCAFFAFEMIVQDRPACATAISSPEESPPAAPFTNTGKASAGDFSRTGFKPESPISSHPAAKSSLLLVAHFHCFIDAAADGHALTFLDAAHEPLLTIGHSIAILS